MIYQSCIPAYAYGTVVARDNVDDAQALWIAPYRSVCIVVPADGDFTAFVSFDGVTYFEHDTVFVNLNTAKRLADVPGNWIKFVAVDPGHDNTTIQWAAK